MKQEGANRQNWRGQSGVLLIYEGLVCLLLSLCPTGIEELQSGFGKTVLTRNITMIYGMWPDL